MSHAELTDLSRIELSHLEDSMVQMAHLIKTFEYDRATEVLRRHNRSLQLLAGYVANLLPMEQAKKSGVITPLPLDRKNAG